MEVYKELLNREAALVCVAGMPQSGKSTYIKELIVKSNAYIGPSSSDVVSVYSLFGLGPPGASTNNTNRLRFASRGAILYPVEIL